MDIKIFPKPLAGKVKAIPSKSHLHRVLIANALSEKPGEIILPRFLRANDIETTKECISSLKNNGDIFYCGESATTLRLLLPLVMVLKGKGMFLGEPQLERRPIVHLLDSMKERGLTYSLDGDLPENINDFTPVLSSPQVIANCQGDIQGGNFKIPGNISSLYISGLLLALPLLKENSRLIVSHPFKSRSYVKLTKKVLADFKIEIDEKEEEDVTVFHIPGNQKYVAPQKIEIEGDWSNGAFWLTANHLSQPSSVECIGLDDNSYQGDRRIKDLLSNLENEIDLADCPDLSPILSILASLSKGKTRLVNGERLKIKESDRIEALLTNLSKMGASVTRIENGLEIEGVDLLEGGMDLDSFADHRIVMAIAIASIRCKEPITIKNFQVVNKSYPSFFEDFKKLGGEYIVI